MTKSATQPSTVSPRAVRDAQPPDRTLSFVIGSIGVSAGIIAAICAFTFSSRFALGVALGGVIALLNFLVLARVGKAITGTRGGAAFWGFVYLVKVAVLFGGVGLLLHAGILPGLSIIVGLTAIVPGIVVGGLLAAPRGPIDGSGGSGS